MVKSVSKTILYVVNNSNYFLSHRLDIALSAKEKGFFIHVACPKDKESEEFKKKGFIHHDIFLTRSGKNLFKEIRTFFNMYLTIKQINPDLLHLITIKPVIYGGIISSYLKIRGVVSAIPGLGYSFIARGVKASIFRFFISFLYGLAFKNNSLKVIFQNEEDRRALTRVTGLSRDKTVLIRGSGVNLSRYNYSQIPKGKPIISMASRLQKDKGVIEYFEAAKLLKEKGVKADFYFIGDLDSSYASTINEKDLLKWKTSNILKFLGFRKDISLLFQQSTIIVLPSYREGFPKVLQEAAACGRPVIASDVPGCRDAVKDGLTGFLVNPKDPIALANKIEYLLSNEELQEKMGNEARKLAEKHFSIEKVVGEHLKLYQDLLL